MRSRIGLLVCAAALLLGELAAAADSSLSSRLGARITQPIRAGSTSQAVYRIEKYQPLLSEPYTNCHAVALHAGADTLEVIHRWEHSSEYDSAAVPWSDIVENRVRYSLSSLYGKARTRQAPAAVEDAKCAKELVKPAESPAALPPRCRRLSSGATLVGQRGVLQLVAAHRGVVWALKLPRGHDLIDFVVHEELLFIATRSNQGAKDGELLLPHQTTHVLVVPAPHPHGGDAHPGRRAAELLIE